MAARLVATEVNPSPPIKEAVILAAGRGLRLDPLTRLWPKPLLPVLGESPFWRWLKIFSQKGFAKVAVNAHWLKGAFVAEIARAAPIFPGLELTLSLEDDLLGTGGGVKRAAKNFSGPVIVVNGDIWSDLDLDSLALRHLEANAFVTIAAAPGRPGGTASVDRKGRVVGLRAPLDSPLKNEAERLFGLGAAVLSQEFLRLLPDGQSDYIEELAKRLERKVLAFKAPYTIWADLGTPKSYLALNRLLAKGKAYVDPKASVFGQIEGFSVVCAGAKIEAGAVSRDSVLLPGAILKKGAKANEAIVAGLVPQGEVAHGVWI
jgi:NDP-sugar pyrophosphorylase family protein